VHVVLSGVALLLAALLAAQSEELAARSQRGKEAMAAGKFAEAAAIYAELTRDLPDNPGLLLNLGMAEHLAGRSQRAIAPLEAALKRDPKLFPAWLFLGIARLDLGEAANAVEPLKKALDIQPAYGDAHQALGDALYALDRYAEAADHFRRAAEIQPQSSRAWYGLGKSYEAWSRGAFAELERTAPASGYWLALVAGMRLAQQQYSGAFYFYRQALARQPDLRGMHAAVADIYRRTGHADWAAAEEQKERRLGPLDCASRPLECAFSQRRYREVLAAAARLKTPEACYWQSLAANELALEALERLARLPASAEWHKVMAESHRNRGQHLEAVKEWREALKLSPQDGGARRELAVSLYQARDYPAAQAAFEELLKRDPNSADLNYYLGDALLSQQQPERAALFLSKAVEADPGDLRARASLARAYVLSGRGALAIPHLQAALPVDEDGSLHYQLARAYQSAGQADLAKEMLEKYQKIRDAGAAERKRLEEEIRITPP
jgi:tetratricopeptide (TPR) repeat protein